MLIYKKTFENIETINRNFPVEDQYYATDTEAIVADGITRDPLGSHDLNSMTNEEVITNYPRPSGAELAAKEIVQTFEHSSGSLKDRLIECNKRVKELNDTYIKECNYLENDYYGAVASCIKIENNIVKYAFICDCGVVVYDQNGQIKFQTEDEKELYSDPYIRKINIPWHLPQARVTVRRDYRNNLKNKENGNCVSYGALTGEETCIPFIKEGEVPLSIGDRVVVYSDGFVKYLHNEDFIKELLNFNKQSFENYVNKASEQDKEKYGKEKTLILFNI